jgi:hypothetical protein
MSTGKPILHATLTKPAGNEVRHLLIYLVDGARETRLDQLSAGSETAIATGTQYEMEQKADALAQLWITNEGFKRQPQDEFVFEPLERTVALAMKMGFTIVFDPSYTKMDRPHFNLTGAVPLSTWRGMTPKNGGGYAYALDQMRLHARPTLPPNHELNVGPSDPKEFPAYLVKVSAFLKTVGPFAEFTLAGD